MNSVPQDELALLNIEQRKEANAQRHALKKIGTTNDIVQMVGFLFSPKSSWIREKIFHVEGGKSTIK